MKKFGRVTFTVDGANVDDLQSQARKMLGMFLGVTIADEVLFDLRARVVSESTTGDGVRVRVWWEADVTVNAEDVETMEIVG